MATLLAGDISLTGKAALNLGTPFYIANKFTASVSGTPNRISYYCSTGTGGGSLFAFIYSVDGSGNPQHPIAYSSITSLAASLSAGWRDYALAGLTSPLVSGTAYIMGIYTVSGSNINGWADTRGTAASNYYSFIEHSTPPCDPWGIDPVTGENHSGSTSPNEAYAIAAYVDTVAFNGWGVPA